VNYCVEKCAKRGKRSYAQPRSTAHSFVYLFRAREMTMGATMGGSGSDKDHVVKKTGGST